MFVSLAVLTSMGTLLHDTKLNKAYELSVPLNSVSINLTSSLEGLNHATSHTHVESASVSSPFDSNPRLQVRDDFRRYYLPKHMSRGNTYFGGSRILWPSV